MLPVRRPSLLQVTKWHHSLVLDFGFEYRGLNFNILAVTLFLFVEQEMTIVVWEGGAQITS